MQKTIAKFTFLFMLLAFSVMAQAQEMEELSNGQCWLRKETNTDWKIASFESGQAVNHSTRNFNHHVNEEVKRALAQYGIHSFPESKYDVVIQCNQKKLHVSISLVNKIQYSLCLIGEFDKAHKFKTTHVFTNPNNFDGNCDRTRQLTLALSTDHLEKVRSLLKSSKWNELVTDVRTTREDLLHITINSDYRFKEAEFKKKLETDSELGTLLSHVGYDFFYYYPGDTKKIDSGVINGF